MFVIRYAGVRHPSLCMMPELQQVTGSILSYDLDVALDMCPSFLVAPLDKWSAVLILEYQHNFVLSSYHGSESCFASRVAIDVCGPIRAALPPPDQAAPKLIP